MWLFGLMYLGLQLAGVAGMFIFLLAVDFLKNLHDTGVEKFRKQNVKKNIQEVTDGYYYDFADSNRLGNGCVRGIFVKWHDGF